MADDKVYIADKTTLDAIKTLTTELKEATAAMKTVVDINKTNIVTVDTVVDKILERVGTANATGGTAAAGSALAKLNALLNGESTGNLKKIRQVFLSGVVKNVSAYRMEAGFYVRAYETDLYSGYIENVNTKTSEFAIIIQDYKIINDQGNLTDLHVLPRITAHIKSNIDNMLYYQCGFDHLNPQNSVIENYVKYKVFISAVLLIYQK